MIYQYLRLYKFPQQNAYKMTELKKLSGSIWVDFINNSNDGTGPGPITKHCTDQVHQSETLCWSLYVLVEFFCKCIDIIRCKGIQFQDFISDAWQMPISNLIFRGCLVSWKIAFFVFIFSFQWDPPQKNLFGLRTCTQFSFFSIQKVGFEYKKWKHFS